MSKSGNNGSGSVGSNASKPGYEVINKFGVNLDIDAGPETIWSHGGLFPFLMTGIPMDLVSTSADDDIAGTGAQKITLTHYLTDNTEIIESFDMAGLARVQINDDLKICTVMELTQVGTGMTNAGEINLVDRATGLVVYQSVEIGLGRTQSSVQICPKGKKGNIIQHSAGYAKTQNPAGSADLRFYLQKANGSRQSMHPAVISTINPKDLVTYPNGSGIAMVEGDLVYWECVTVSATDTPIEARFDMEVFDA